MLALALLLTFSAHAQVRTPMLFKVRAPNGTVSYLFGSVHYGIGLDELPPSTLEVFRQSAAHAYELDVSHEWDLMRRVRREPKLMDELMRLANRDPAAPGDFNDAEVGQLVALGLPEHVARRMRNDQCQPFIFREYIFGTSPARSLDGELQIETHRLGRRLIELETDEDRDQARAQADAQGYDNSCSIVKYLRDPAKREDEDRNLRSILADYRSAGPADLLAMGDDEDPDVQIRNQAWMKTLVPLVSSTPSFIAVGLYHLPGPHGLIQLFKTAGFTVEAI